MIKKLKKFLIKKYYKWQRKCDDRKYKRRKKKERHKVFLAGKKEKIVFPENAMEYKTLIICAHPDDETIFFSKVCKQEDVFVICMSNIGHEVRKKEFYTALTMHGIQGMMFNMPEALKHTFAWTNYPMRRTLKRIKTLFYNVDAIYTHNVKGESGHPQHFDLGKQVGKVFKGYKVYYSAEQITEKDALTEEEATFKLKVMNECYTSQLKMLNMWCPWYPSYMANEGYETK